MPHLNTVLTVNIGAEMHMQTVGKKMSAEDLCHFQVVNPESAKQNLQQTTFQFFCFYLSKKIRLDFSCES